MSAAKHSVHSLVVCCRAGMTGCDKDCPHRVPHKAHKAGQTEWDDHRHPCTAVGFCETVGYGCQCRAHNASGEGREV
jgi:hypothetical protein